ncbi:MAG: efflux RND transporter permease subunit, partial [Planctomycetota bacterium]
MDSLIRWSLHHRFAVLTLAIILSAWGAYSAWILPVDVFPNLTAPTVTIITEARGLNPVELETQVTYRVESAMNGARGVRRVRSTTTPGFSIVWVEFDWDFDRNLARQVVSERLSFVRSALPAGIDPPVLAPVSSIMGEILFVAVVGGGIEESELRTYAENVVRQRLLATPGVSQVSVLGGGRRQYQVILSPDALLNHRVSIDEISRAIREANENSTAGYLTESGNQYLVTGSGRLRDVEELHSVSVRTRGGYGLPLGELAEVRIGAAPRVGVGAANREPAVILSVQKQPSANTLTLTDALSSRLDELERELPAGVRVVRDLFRQRDFIDVAVRNVFHALRDGSLLVVLILAAFLWNGPATLITLTAIPLSLTCSVLLLSWAGSSFNTMTLGGMAIAIGALVDDAVIDVENVLRRLRERAASPEHERRSILEVVFEASVEIRASIVFATFIVILVFLPVFFLSGIEGR